MQAGSWNDQGIFNAGRYTTRLVAPIAPLPYAVPIPILILTVTPGLRLEPAILDDWETLVAGKN